MLLNALAWMWACHFPTFLLFPASALQAFYMVGDINEVVAKADKMAAELGEAGGP